jgi:hypothetical protein
MVDRFYNWRKRNPEKAKAHSIFKDAVHHGKIVKPNQCSKCLKRFPLKHIHGHHKNYSKPLEVIWVCHWCHQSLHEPSGFKKRLTEEQVIEIRRLGKTGLNYNQVSKCVGVNRGTVRHILIGDTWKNFNQLPTTTSV